VHRTDGALRVEGDVHFAFLTPEPAFEDTDLAAQMLRAGLVTPRFLLALTMIDFSNPVFSRRRAQLLRYVPDELASGHVAQELETRFVASMDRAVRNAEGDAGAANSAEREFLDLWSVVDVQASAIGRISDYFAALRAGADDPSIVDGWFRLAEYRRRCFRERKLAEFALTTPQTNIPADAPALRMSPRGVVEPI
jgi:hypothetical protein